MPESLLDLCVSAINAEIERYGDNLTPAEKEQASTSLKYLVEELLAMALAPNDVKREYHRANVTHYLAELKAVSPLLSAVTYDLCVNILGRLLVDLAKATNHPLE